MLYVVNMLNNAKAKYTFHDLPKDEYQGLKGSIPLNLYGETNAIVTVHHSGIKSGLPDLHNKTLNAIELLLVLKILTLMRLKNKNILIILRLMRPWAHKWV